MAEAHTDDAGEWARGSHPAPRGNARVLGRWTPTRAVDITRGRRQLGAALDGGPRPAGATEDAVQRLVLIFEELVSNAVRHGRPPIEVVLTASACCWLLEVVDAAGQVPPTPDPGRDPALGGLGLSLVAELGSSYGTESRNDGHKIVWASVHYLRDAGPGSPA